MLTFKGDNAAAVAIVASGLAAAGFAAAASRWLPAAIICAAAASIAGTIDSRRKRLSDPDSTGPARPSKALVASMLGLFVLGVLISVVWNTIST